MTADEKENQENGKPVREPITDETTRDLEEEHKTEEVLEFQTTAEMGAFVNYIEDPVLLEFARAVKSKSDEVLIQKGTALRVSLFKTLKNRSDQIKESFQFKYTKNLKDRLKKNLWRHLFECLEPGRYHISRQLNQVGELDYEKMTSIALDKIPLLELFTRMHRDQDPILPHLGETALMAAGIAEHICNLENPRDQRSEIVKKALLAGLLHDVALSGADDWLEKDTLEPHQNGHTTASVRNILRELPDLEDDVVQAIQEHHRAVPIWKDAANFTLDTSGIIRESLVFSEFFLGRINHLKASRQTAEEAMEKLFFEIGQAIDKGFFHSRIMTIMGTLQERFKSILEFGHAVSRVESQCLFGDSAVAYPSPRCTQMLCLGKHYECEKMGKGTTIEIIHGTSNMGWIGDKIKPDSYPKCKLVELLPDLPESLQ